MSDRQDVVGTVAGSRDNLSIFVFGYDFDVMESPIVGHVGQYMKPNSECIGAQ